MKRLKILTWHIHGSYLNTLARIDHDWYIPVKPGRPPRYIGRGPTFDAPDYLREVPAEEVRNLDLDLILFQTPENYLEDQYEILSSEQQKLPKIYLEHNVPRPHATDTRHPVDDPNILLVHVTHYNRLMWNNNRTPTTVIEHSVAINPNVTYQGTVEKGITVINAMPRRGRIVGQDIFLNVRRQIPLDLAGMMNEGIEDCLGDIPYRHLHQVVAQYRFMFSPIRYTSLPLAVIEGLTIGMPIVALGTTEVPTVIENGKHGYVSCDVEELVERMRDLLSYPDEARRLGANARELARERFGLERFIRDWNAAFALVTNQASSAKLHSATAP
jgi:glycosyltransferase involved in cell wall biosynthesis